MFRSVLLHNLLQNKPLPLICCNYIVVMILSLLTGAALWRLLIKVLDVVMFTSPGHCVLFTQTFYFLGYFIPVLVVLLNIVCILHHNLIGLPIVWRISSRIVT